MKPRPHLHPQFEEALFRTTTSHKKGTNPRLPPYHLHRQFPLNRCLSRPSPSVQQELPVETDRGIPTRTPCALSAPPLPPSRWHQVHQRRSPQSRRVTGRCSFRTHPLVNWDRVLHQPGVYSLGHVCTASVISQVCVLPQPMWGGGRFWPPPFLGPARGQVGDAVVLTSRVLRKKHDLGKPT